MEQLTKLGKVWTCVYSSSIENFHEKLDKRLGLPREWRMFSPVLFIGMYHIGDYLKYVFHYGEKRVFWCGSDILNLEKSWWKNIVLYQKARHFVESGVEQEKLFSMGVYAEIIPMIFDNPNNYHPTFKLADKTHVWMCVHEDREEEYGLYQVLNLADELKDIVFHIFGEVNHTQDFIDFYASRNVVFHGKVSEEQFNNLISYYHISIRLNKFDGFSEVTAKSILLGQYPITFISYPNIDSCQNEKQLFTKVRELRLNTKSNPQEAFWRRHLEQSLVKLTS